MKYTENYNLKKPEATDSYNVDDFNKNSDVIDIIMKEFSDLLKVEDISNDFMTHNSDDSFCEARLLTVHKQGNVISGKVAISGSFGEASGNDLKWTINSKYKPKQGIVICQCMTIGTQGTQPNAEIGCFIGDDQLELVTGGLYDYEGIVLSFSYIC